MNSKHATSSISPWVTKDHHRHVKAGR